MQRLTKNCMRLKSECKCWLEGKCHRTVQILSGLCGIGIRLPVELVIIMVKITKAGIDLKIFQKVTWKSFWPLIILRLAVTCLKSISRTVKLYKQPEETFPIILVIWYLEIRRSARWGWKKRCILHGIRWRGTYKLLLQWNRWNCVKGWQMRKMYVTAWTWCDQRRKGVSDRGKGDLFRPDLDGEYGFYRTLMREKSYERLNRRNQMYGEINSIDGDKKVWQIFLATGSRGVLYGEMLSEPRQNVSNLY